MQTIIYGYVKWNNEWVKQIILQILAEIFMLESQVQSMNVSGRFVLKNEEFQIKRRLVSLIMLMSVVFVVLSIVMFPKAWNY